MRDESRYRKLVEYVGFAELMAVLMVLATAFSAVATWRTASIATALYDASERPYLGVEKVALDREHPGDCRLVVRYRNFGNVAAEDAVVRGRVFLDGKPASDEVDLRAGIISPSVPHQIFVHAPDDQIDAVLSGQTRLALVVAASYHGPARPTLCYVERFAYIPQTRTFEVDGGSSRCSDIGYWIDGGPGR